jgi:hypothetical protein
MLVRFLPALAFVFAPIATQAAEIERIWLTHQTHEPTAIVINWESAEPGDAHVEYGPAADRLTGQAEAKEQTTLHHVEIPLSSHEGTCFYRVRTDADASAVHSFQNYPKGELRVAMVADTGYTKAKWAEAVLAVHPHLLLSAGDHVPALHKGTPVPPQTTTAFSEFIGRNAALFQSTPWMPALGNHDRELRPRGPKPPPEPVYDPEAQAFRKFVALPDPEWRWYFDVPAFGARFIAIDMSHLQDMGTTWQTCHPYAVDGPQFPWYRDLMATSRQPYVVTFDNEQNSKVRGLEKGAWAREIQRGSLCVTGFGYFAERAEVNDFTYYNTSVNGTGDRYPDPKSRFLASEDNFVLMTFRREPQTLRVELRNMSGNVLDAKEFAPRRQSSAAR